jgi:hypothetical protein
MFRPCHGSGGKSWACHRSGPGSRSGHVGFVVDKVALGQVFSEYFGFTCQFSFHRPLHTHRLSSGAGTIDQLVADVPSGLSLTPPQGTKKKPLGNVRVTRETTYSILTKMSTCYTSRLEKMSMEYF